VEGKLMSHKFNVKMEAELTHDELSTLFERYGERVGAQWEITPIGEPVSSIEIPKKEE
jgi:hypothetical protein